MTDYSAVWWRVKASIGHPQMSGQQAGSGLCGCGCGRTFQNGLWVYRGVATSTL